MTMTFAVGEADEVSLLQMLEDHDKEMPFEKKIILFFPHISIVMREEKGEVIHEEIPKPTLFEQILNKSTHPLLGTWSLLLVHVWFTPGKGPKGFKNAYFRNYTMKVGP